MLDSMTEALSSQMAKMCDQALSVTKLKLEVSTSPADNAKWNLLTGILRVPRRGHQSGLLTYTEVLLKREDDLIVEVSRARTQEDGTVMKSRMRHTATLRKPGLPVYEQEECSVMGTWLEEINHAKDMVKNPLNTHLHRYLDKKERPHKGEELFITADGDVYMKVQSNSWVPIGGKMNWVESHLHNLPESFSAEVQRYFLAQRLRK